MPAAGMNEAEKAALTAAMAEVRNTDGVFFLALRRASGGGLWTAAVAHDEVCGDLIVHCSDPAVFEASHADAAGAVRFALDMAGTALREPPRID